MTVEELIEELQKFAKNAIVTNAYGDEIQFIGTEKDNEMNVIIDFEEEEENND